MKLHTDTDDTTTVSEGFTAAVHTTGRARQGDDFRRLVPEMISEFETLLSLRNVERSTSTADRPQYTRIAISRSSTFSTTQSVSAASS